LFLLVKNNKSSMLERFRFLDRRINNNIIAANLLI